jgi:hypothetical protein
MDRRARSIFADLRILKRRCHRGGRPRRGRKAHAGEYDRFIASHDAQQRDLCDTRCFGIRRELFELLFDAEDLYCEDAALGRRLRGGIPIRFVRDWTVGHHYTARDPGAVRLRRYAASTAYLHRTDATCSARPARGPGGPGASVCECAAAGRRCPGRGRGPGLAALAVGAGARARRSWAAGSSRRRAARRSFPRGLPGRQGRRRIEP